MTGEISNDEYLNAVNSRERMRELVEKHIDLGRVDESAKEIAEMLFMVAPKSITDGDKHNLALEGAMYAYTFTSDFEENFKNFIGVACFDSTVPKSGEAKEVSEQSH